MRNLAYLSTLVSLGLASFGLFAADVLIQNAKVYTATDAGLIENGSILIREGRIAAVGEQVEAGPDAMRIDASGKQITPGLVNSYTRLGLLEINLIAQTVDATTKDEQYSASFAIAAGINPYSTLIPYNRTHGLTQAIVVPGSGHHLFAGQGAAIRLSDDPDMVVIDDSVAVFANFGSAGGEMAGGSRAAAYIKMRHALLDAREYGKNRQAIRTGKWRTLSLPLHDLAALLPVLNASKPFVVKVEKASDIKKMLDLAQEFQLNLVLAGATEGWMVAAEIARAGVPVILNPMANLPANFDRLGARFDNARLLHEAGVKILLSRMNFIMETHAAHLVRQAAGNAVSYGLPIEEAIKAMSLYPAQVFGFAERFGSIEPGKQADLVIWSGDPLELLTRAEQVIIAGQMLPMVSRSTRLGERYRKLDAEPSFIYRK